MASGRFELLRKAWNGLAVVFLNTCLLLVVLNLGLFVAFEVVDARRARPHRDARSPETLSRFGEVHPGMRREEIRALWEETYRASSGFVYEPFTQFRIAAFEGEHITVDVNGFRRHAGAGPWPPDADSLNVFLYGGSTAFGYGVGDEQTVAAHLQRDLAGRLGASSAGGPVRVYNFGRSGYFSTQERLLFERQLAHGTPPDVAVFLDGLNDSRIVDGLPIFTARFERLFELGDTGASTALARLPMMRLARAVTRGGRGAAAVATPEAEEERSREMAARYLANRRMIEAVAAAHGVGAFFVWQPVAFYGYDRSHHLFAEHREPPHVEAGYRHMATLAADGRLGESFLWLADMQRGVEEPLYVDQAHYSGPMGRRIAGRIGRWLVERGALERTGEAAE